MKSKVHVPFMESLEGRTLLSGTALGGLGGLGGMGGGHLHVPAVVADDPAVQADLAQIQTDRAQLQADQLALADTIKTDLAAIAAAIKAVDTTALRDVLKADRLTWAATIKADVLAIRTDLTNGDTAQLAIDKQTLKDDLAAAKSAIQADTIAIRDAVKNDAAVQAAKAQLESDSAPLAADKAALNADFVQLKADVQAALAALGTTTSTKSPIGPDPTNPRGPGTCPPPGDATINGTLTFPSLQNFQNFQRDFGRR